jgi:hypothetical protein
MMLTSHMCRQADFSEPWYARWAGVDDRNFGLHRKNWEYRIAAEALRERGMLIPGKRGLGFSVGQESLPAAFAGLGCEIVATDLDPELAAPDGWVRHGHHCAAKARLHNPGLCSAEDFDRLVTFAYCDCRQPLEVFGGFDFLWSMSSLEHFDDFDAGLAFVERSMACLKPGGVGIYTTEYNCTSNDDTIFRGRAVTGGGWPYVVYRRRDFEALAERLAAAGHTMAPLDFDPGDGEWDRMFWPEGGHPRDGLVKHHYDGFGQTSFVLIVERGR